MTKSVAVINKQDLIDVAHNPVKLNELFGFEGRPKPVIPILRIEGSDDEEGVVKAPKGSFVYDDGSRLLHAKEVSIRSFLKAYQYRRFDPKEPAKNDVSIIAPNFKAEFISTSGLLACGKLSKKVFEQIASTASAEQKEAQEKVKCKLLIFGVLSGDFVDVDTREKVKVEDALFTWIVSQSGFMSMDGTITGIEKERRGVPLTPIDITLKKEKTGQVTFFVPIPVVSTETAMLDVERDVEYLRKIKDFVAANNRHVTEKYNEAIKNKLQNEKFATLGEIIEGKAKHAKTALPVPDDEIPF